MRYARASIAVLALAVTAASNVSAQETDGSTTGVHVLHEYLEDRCSFVPDLDIGFCCGDHDEAYAIGGDRKDRLNADRSFRQCIRNAGRPVVAFIYYWGVRLFGWIFFNFDGV